MSNIFDQFDTAKATQSQPQEPQGQPQTKNIFDQFDSKEQVGQKEDPQSKNIFDQFDAKQPDQNQPQAAQGQAQSKNIFDQFDAPAQAQQSQQQKDSGWWDDLKNMVTGDSQETRGTKELPELESAIFGGKASGFLSTLPTASAVKLAAAIATTSDPKERAKMIKAAGPEFGIQYDEKGNIYAANNKTGQIVALNKPGLSASDLLPAFGQLAAFYPAGEAATLTGAAVKSAAADAALQGTEKMGGGNDIDLSDVALSGALGAAGKGIENVIGAGYRAATGAPAKEPAELIKDANKLGVPLTTSDVIPPTTKPGKFAKDVGEAIPIVGTSGIREQQQAARKQAAENLQKKYIPDYNTIIDSIKGKAAAVKKKAIDARQSVVEKVKDIQTPANNTIEAIDKEIDRLTTLPGGQPRSKVEQALVDTLEKYKKDIQTGGDFKTLEDMRTKLREDLSPDFTKSGTRQEGAIKRIYGAMTKDMDDVVKNNLSTQDLGSWKKGNAVYGKEMEKLQKSRIKNILNAGEDLSPEQIDQKLMNKDSIVRQRMYEALGDKGRKNARSAIISRIFDKASSGGELSVNKLVSELERNKGALDTFFKGSQRKEIEGLRKVLNATRGAQDASVVTKTGQTLAPLIGAALGITATLPTAILTLGSGGLTRAYESKMFRSALLKLANSKKGSSQFESALSDVQDYLTLSAQAARRSDSNQQQ